MNSIRKRLPTPAMVVACLALTVALGGVSYAAAVLPKNSVGTAQLKKNAVKSKKVADHTLLARDFKAGQLPAGARGPKGEVGPSAAFSAGENNVLPATSGSEQTLVTLNLPAGAFALFAKVLGNNNSASAVADIACQLDAGGTIVDASNHLRIGPESISSSDTGFYVSTGTVTLPAPAAATLKCTTTDQVNYHRRAITAVQVGAIG